MSGFEPRYEQNGSVELKSGRWNWSFTAMSGGHMLILKHTNRPRDEMKTWLDFDSAGFDIREAARQPVYRVWEDMAGAVWLVSVDFASLQKDSHLWLNFRNAFRELSAFAPSDLALGELTSRELSQYLKEAS